MTNDDDTPGAALDSAIERLRFILLDSNDVENAVQMRKLFAVSLIDTMERARDALRDQDAPAPTGESAARLRGLALFKKAKDSAVETGARESWDAHYFKCTPQVSLELWTLIWRKAVEWWSGPIEQAAPAPRGMFMLHTHEQIRAKYFDRINPPTAFERLLFDTAVDNPAQGEALRAFFEGRHD